MQTRRLRYERQGAGGYYTETVRCTGPTALAHFEMSGRHVDAQAHAQYCDEGDSCWCEVGSSVRLPADGLATVRLSNPKELLRFFIEIHGPPEGYTLDPGSIVTRIGFTEEA